MLREEFNPVAQKSLKLFSGSMSKGFIFETNSLDVEDRSVKDFTQV